MLPDPPGSVKVVEKALRAFESRQVSPRNSTPNASKSRQKQSHRKDTQEYFGHILDHNDRDETKKLKEKFDETKNLWNKTYDTDYLLTGIITGTTIGLANTQLNRSCSSCSSPSQTTSCSSCSCGSSCGGSCGGGGD